MPISVDLTRLRIHEELVQRQITQLRLCRGILDQQLALAMQDPCMFEQIHWQQKQLAILESAIQRRLRFLQETDLHIWHLTENMNDLLESAAIFDTP